MPSKRKLMALGLLAAVAAHSNAGAAPGGCHSDPTTYPAGRHGILFERTYCQGSGGFCETCRVHEHEAQTLRSTDLQSPKRLLARKRIALDPSLLQSIRNDIGAASRASLSGFSTFNLSHEAFAFLPGGKAVLLQAHRTAGCEERNLSPRKEALLVVLAQYCPK